jgi:hypothetical protein
VKTPGNVCGCPRPSNVDNASGRASLCGKSQGSHTPAAASIPTSEYTTMPTPRQKLASCALSALPSPSSQVRFRHQHGSLRVHATINVAFSTRVTRQGYQCLGSRQSQRLPNHTAHAPYLRPRRRVCISCRPPHAPGQICRSQGQQEHLVRHSRADSA